MNTPRHAAGSNRTREALELALLLTTGALAATSALLAFATARVARRVVTPSPRVFDTSIVGLDTGAQTITLQRTDDTVLPGRYGLFTAGDPAYVKVGSVLAETDATVTRKLLTRVESTQRLGEVAAFSGWYYDRPEQLQLPFRNEMIGSGIGPCPAWIFPVDGSDVWVIQVHGRGSTRAEGLRAVPLFHDLGMTSLLVSYRNDGEAPRTRAGTYTLGASEWRDVDAAIGYALRHGARRVVLMGWSMGGAISLQAALSSAHREAVAGVILDSPVIEWKLVLGFQAKQLHVPRSVATLALQALDKGWASSLTGADGSIPFDRLDIVGRATELRQPILILHSEDDGYVPSDASHDLVVARPDLVDIESFTVARHAKLWNYDQERWTSSIRRWLDRQGLIGGREASDS